MVNKKIISSTGLVKFTKLAARYRKFLYILLPIILVSLYLNTASNHFYHRLHSAGLIWPQNQDQYKIGKPESKPTVYVALGDSLTTGVGATSFDQTYSYMTAEQILGKYHSISLTPLATPGFKSADLISHYLDRTIQLQPDVVTILIGVNDVHGTSPSAEQFRANYETLLGKLHNQTKADIYTISIPYIGTNGLIWPPYSNYYSSRTKSFNKIIYELAKKYDATYIDLYSATINYSSKQSNYYSKDSFHPSSSGYTIWAKAIAGDINN